MEREQAIARAEVVMNQYDGKELLSDLSIEQLVQYTAARRITELNQVRRADKKALMNVELPQPEEA